MSLWINCVDSAFLAFCKLEYFRWLMIVDIKLELGRCVCILCAWVVLGPRVGQHCASMNVLCLEFFVVVFLVAYGVGYRTYTPLSNSGLRE